ncbi:hypothetical protein P3T25_002500 [Paraburkholderia sp. GAS32]|jgi:hypothetical protein
MALHAVTATAQNDVTVVSTGKISSGTTVGINAQHDINVAGAVVTLAPCSGPVNARSCEAFSVNSTFAQWLSNWGVSVQPVPK